MGTLETKGQLALHENTQIHKTHQKNSHIKEKENQKSTGQKGKSSEGNPKNTHNKQEAINKTRGGVFNHQQY